MKWMEQDSSKWSAYTMKSFILAQNGYSYDGESPMTHSPGALAQFAGINGDQKRKFFKIYAKMYNLTVPAEYA